MQHLKKNLISTGVCLALSSLGPGVVAQGVLEEVMVTATKRAESIQDVPISVAAVSGETIQNLGIMDMEQLSLLIPNFEINSASILPNLYVRGLGSGASHSIEQSVGRFIDEVYIGRAAINLHGFMDLAGVEVLRGPQSTLFGKNTVAGALIMNTAKPTSEFESGFTASTSTYETTGGNNEIEGYVSGPLTENLAARLAVRYRDADGFYENRLPGPGGPNRDESMYRLSFAWTPTDQTRVDLKLEHAEFDESGADTGEWNGLGGPPLFVYQLHSPEFTPVLDWTYDVDCSDVIANRDTTGDGEADTAFNTGSFCPSRDQESQNVTLRLEHDVAAGTFTSISAFQTYDYQHEFVGLDMGLASGFRARRNEDYEGFTQEFRFASAPSDGMDYIVGVYFEDSQLSRFQNSSINLATVFFDPNGAFIDRYEPWSQDTQTIAGFGQVQFELSEDLSLILGGRYASEDKDFEFERYFAQYQTNNRLDIPGGPGGPPVVATDSRSESKFTGAVTLQWDYSDNTMLYANFSQGHKTGGFSDRIEGPGADFEFDEENVDSFEVGAKASLLDGALALNIALYHMDIEGLQLSTQIPGDVPAFAVSNAADSTSRGIEFDSTWAVSSVWTLGANFAYTDAEYDSFPGAECFPGTPVDPDPETGTCDLAGLPLIFAPELKAALFADFQISDAVGGWGIGGRLDVSYSDEFYTDISYEDNVLTESFTLYNAVLRMNSPSERFTVSLIGKNLTNEKYCAWCIPSGPNILAAMNPPREIALQLRATFD
ncbi:putative TonB-dependent receptor [gamma proteobacterium NOR5-3]|nr:putative TonB-dependent receptor [gamma proteobacterium NOR5-3]